MKVEDNPYDKNDRSWIPASSWFWLQPCLQPFSPFRAWHRRLKPQDVAAAVHAKLDKSQYKDVQVNVDANGVATLTGTVSLYEYKADADKSVHKVKGVTAVRNEIQVAGPSVPDSQLEKKPRRKAGLRPRRLR